MLTIRQVFCYNSSCAGHGGVSEWLKELVLKTSVPARDRGFESHPLRHQLLLVEQINTSVGLNYGVVLKRLKRTVC